MEAQRQLAHELNRLIGRGKFEGALAAAGTPPPAVARVRRGRTIARPSHRAPIKRRRNPGRWRRWLGGVLSGGQLGKPRVCKCCRCVDALSRVECEQRGDERACIGASDVLRDVRCGITRQQLVEAASCGAIVRGQIERPEVLHGLRVLDPIEAGGGVCQINLTMCK